MGATDGPPRITAAVSTLTVTAAGLHWAGWASDHAALAMLLPKCGTDIPSALGVCELAMRMAAPGTKPSNIGADIR